jgi:hypothetical protein
MKIFISHATSSNYQEELYAPLRNSELNTKHEIILPHENGQDISTKDIIRDCDLVVGEVSTPSFGQGIELGWANASYVTILCFYKTGATVSDSLKYVTESMYAYDSIEELIKKITETADAL